MTVRSRVGTWPVLVAAVALTATGCSSKAPAEWNQADDARQAELESASWLAGSRAWEVSGPIRQHLRRADAADGVWDRPSVRGGAAVDGGYLDVAAGEVSAAKGAGWAPVFAWCDPQTVVVDLVRVLDDGGVGTARLEVGATRPGGSTMQLTAVSLHHSDGDWVLSPSVSELAALDVGLCLDEPVAVATWSGEPALLSSSGGPAPTDA